MLTWTPALPPGDYQVTARLIYDLNRYNDPALGGDQTETNRAALMLELRGPAPGDRN